MTSAQRRFSRTDTPTTAGPGARGVVRRSREDQEPVDCWLPQNQAIWTQFQPAITQRAAIAPGDLILLSDNGRASGTHHVAIYLGDGWVVEAPKVARSCGSPPGSGNRR